MKSVNHSLACVALFMAGLALQAQSNTLLILNGQKVPVIITEITAKDIIYKLPNRPDHPLFHFKRKNVRDKQWLYCSTDETPCYFGNHGTRRSISKWPWQRLHATPEQHSTYWLHLLIALHQKHRRVPGKKA